MEKQNRAERRRNKFGGGRATEHGGWPEVQPNPVFSADEPDGAADETATAAADAPKAKPSGKPKPKAAVKPKPAAKTISKADAAAD